MMKTETSDFGDNDGEMKNDGRNNGNAMLSERNDPNISVLS